MTIRDLQAVVYTDDKGVDWVTAMDSTVFAQLSAFTGTPPKVGGADYDGSPVLAPLPKNIVPRHVVVSNSGNKRRVVCLTPTARLFVTGGDTAIDLPVLGAAAVTYTKYKAVSEHDKRRDRDPTG